MLASLACSHKAIVADRGRRARKSLVALWQFGSRGLANHVSAAPTVATHAQYAAAANANVEGLVELLVASGRVLVATGLDD